MATTHTRSAARLMMAPSVILLFAWMIVPLAMTIYFSLLRYNLLMPGTEEFAGIMNYQFFLTDPAFFDALSNTLILVGGVLAITINRRHCLRAAARPADLRPGIVRILVIAPFFVMPTVSALVWKNMFMNPVNGLFGWLARAMGFQPIDFLASVPLLSPSSSSSLAVAAVRDADHADCAAVADEEQKEAAEMDGAGFVSRFIYIVLPHMARAITVVILIETIFLLSVFAEILVTTNGGPGTQSTNLTYLVYAQALLQFDIGGASAGGIVAVVLANIVAIFLVRLIGKNLEG